MKLAYVDSSVWIIYREGLRAYRDIINSQLTAFDNDEWELCFSDAVILEVLLKPSQKKQYDVVNAYDEIFSEATYLPDFNHVFKKALTIAIENKLRVMDGIHLAFAKEYQCDLFITTDQDFKNVKEVSILWIDLSVIQR